MSNNVEINLTEDDIQHLLDAVQRLNGEGNEDIFTWNYSDFNGDPIEVIISVGEDPEE